MAETNLNLAQDRGRSVETRLAFQTTARTMADDDWKRVRFYSLTAGMSRSWAADDQLGLADANARDQGRRRKTLPGGSLRRVTPINMVEAGYWLSAAFRRAATSGAVGAYVHTFNSGDRPSNLLSLAQKWEDGTYSCDVGVAVAELQLSAAKTDAAAKFTMTLIGLSEQTKKTGLVAWPVGDVAAAAPEDDFSDWQWRAKIDDALVGDATGIDVNINLGVERVNLLDGDEFPSGHFFGVTTSTGTLRLFGAASAIRDLSENSEPVKLTLEAVDPENDDRFIRIELHNVLFDEGQKEIQGPGSTSKSFAFGAGQSGPQCAVVITLGNDVAAY